MKQGQIIIGVVVLVILILIIANWSKIKKYCGGGYLGYPFWGGGCGQGFNYSILNNRGCFRAGGEVTQPAPNPTPITIQRVSVQIPNVSANCNSLFQQINSENNMNRRNQLISLYNMTCSSQPQGMTGACEDWIRCTPNDPDCGRLWRRCVASLGR